MNNPKETIFMKNGQKFGNITENGKMMFIYQAQASFRLWHNFKPEINDDLIKFLDQ